MGQPPKNLPMTTEQMLSLNEDRKPKLQKRREAIEANKDTISSLVGNLADRLEEAERYDHKIALKDAEAVKDITLRYLRSCQISGTMPSMAGVALSLGVAPETLSRFMKNNAETDSGKWFWMIKSHFADIINQASLDGVIQPIPAIFTLKANYGWRDDPEPEVHNNDGTEELTPDAIAAKWKDLPE